jgi:hypothetical protein
VNKIIEGQITFGGIHDALKAISLLKYVRNGVMRITSHEASGLIGVFCGRYITGAVVTLSGETGYAALRRLLSANDGSFSFLDAADEILPELRQSLAIDINLLVETSEIQEGTPLSEDSLTGMNASPDDQAKIFDTSMELGHAQPAVEADRIARINRTYDRIASLSSYMKANAGAQASAEAGPPPVTANKAFSSLQQQQPGRQATAPETGGDQRLAGGPPRPADDHRSPGPAAAQPGNQSQSSQPPLPTAERAQPSQPPPLPKGDSGKSSKPVADHPVEPERPNPARDRLMAAVERSSLSQPQEILKRDAEGFEEVDYSKMRRSSADAPPKAVPLPDASQAANDKAQPQGEAVGQSDKNKSKPSIPPWDVPYEPPVKEEEPLPSHEEFGRLRHWKTKADQYRIIAFYAIIVLVCAGLSYFAAPHLMKLLEHH